MIAKPHQLGTAAAAAAYHKDNLVDPGHTLLGGQDPGLWLGQGAELLGLAGAVETPAFLNVLSGRHPTTGEQQTARLKANRRTGFDWVFAPDKTVSVAWGVGGIPGIKEVHEAAVQAAFKMLETFAAARVREDPNSKDSRTTGNLIASMFTHHTARPAEQGVVSDVFLHSHVVIANLVFDAAAGEHGGWRALEMEPMLEARDLVDAVYNHELARGLRELGYDLVTAADGKSVAIADVPKSATDLFSKRHADIEQRTKAVLASGAGSNRAKIAEVVAHQGRTKKDVTTTQAELQANWRQQLFAKLPKVDAHRFFNLIRRLGRPSGVNPAAEQTPFQAELLARLARVKPPAELTPKEFVAEHDLLERRVAAAVKTPGRQMTPEEVALSQKDWRAFSKQRGYTEAEIAEYDRWLQLHDGFTAETLQWSTPAELHQAIVAKAAYRGEPVSAKAALEYQIPLPKDYVQDRTKTLFERKRPKRPAELTPAEFRAEYLQLARRVAEAEKTPDRDLTPEEVAVWVKDWKEYSKQQGYTEAETADYERWQDMNGGFSENWTSPEDAHRAAATEAVKRGRPVSAEAVNKYGIPLPDGYVANGNGLVVRVITEEAALAWAVEHCFEREAVTRSSNLLKAALRYAAGSERVTVEGLAKRIRTDASFIWSKDGNRLTTRNVAAREKAMVGLVQEGRNQYEPLVEKIPAALRQTVTAEVRAARELASDAMCGCPTITAEDLTDAAGLIEHLIAQADPLAKSVWDRFPAKIQTILLSDAAASVKAEALVEGLNACLTKESLYSAKRFEGVELSEGSRLLLSKEPKGRALLRLNRSLLSDAYCEALKPTALKPAPVRRDFELSMSELEGLFSEAQRRSALDTVESKDFLSVFKGGAGRGKSFAIVYMEKLLENEGTNVVVTAPQNKQVNTLTQDRGKAAITVSSLLAMRKPLPPKSVLLVDEAGQIGTQTMFSLICYAKEYHARVILSGDTAQLSSVEAGNAMRAIEKFTDAKTASLGTEVHEIKRQKQSWFREVVALAEQGKAAESFDRLDKLDRAGRAHEAAHPDAEARADKVRIHEFGKAKPERKKGEAQPKSEVEVDRRQAVAAKSVALMLEQNAIEDPKERAKHTHLVISQTCKETDLLNELIREEMVKEGLLTGEERKLRTLKPGNCTAAEKGLTELYGDNTRLLAGLDLLTEDPHRVIPKGSVMKLVGLEKKGRMRVVTNDGREHVISKEDGKKLAIGELTDLSVRVGDLLKLQETLQVGIDLPGQACKMPDGSVRRHTHKRRIPNGSIVKVVGWNKQGQTIIEVEEGKTKVQATLTRPILAKRGYAITSYGAQGQTVRFVLFCDSGSKGGTDARQWYVLVSRAKEGVWIFTDDKADLRERIQRIGDSELALELLAEREAPDSGPSAKPSPEPADEPASNPFDSEIPEPDGEPGNWASEPTEVFEGTQIADPDDEDVAAIRQEEEQSGYGEAYQPTYPHQPEPPTHDNSYDPSF